MPGDNQQFRDNYDRIFGTDEERKARIEKLKKQGKIKVRKKWIPQPAEFRDKDGKPFDETPLDVKL